MTTHQVLSRRDFLFNALSLCVGASLPLSMPARLLAASSESVLSPLKIKRLNFVPPDDSDEAFPLPKTKIFCMGKPGLYAVSQMVKQFGTISPCIDYLFINTQKPQNVDLYLPEQTRHFIADLLDDSHQVLIITDANKENPEGLTSMIAEMSRERKNLTVTFIASPETPAQTSKKKQQWKRLTQANDAVIRIPPVSKEAIPLLSAAIFGLCHAIYSPGYVCMDFEDMNIILKGAGEVQFGMGIASGENRALTAARKALSQFPAKTYHSNKPAGLLFLITTHDEDDCTFEELTDAADLLHDHLRPFDNIEYVWAHRMTPYIQKGEMLVTFYAG